MKPPKDLTGKSVGKLTFLAPAFNKTYGRYNHRWFWWCVCSCLARTIVTRSESAYSDANGSKSCGCLSTEEALKVTLKHGMQGTPVYESWRSMRQRCLNPNHDEFKHYGGRGIRICDAWDEFENFRSWAESNGHSPGLTIERKDVNGHYEPSNCEWITKTAQCKNTRRTRWVEYKGKTVKLFDLMPLSLVNYETLNSRIRSGWHFEKALFTPPTHVSQANTGPKIVQTVIRIDRDKILRTEREVRQWSQRKKYGRL